MNCPHCNEENPQKNIFCSNCGLKMKEPCPNCRALNPVNAERCLECGFKLVTFCPKCKTPNNTTDRNCSNCGEPLLKPCPRCGFLNSHERVVCLECSVSLDTPTRPEEEGGILIEYAVLSAELINLSAIKSRIKREDIVLKLENKFYQIVAHAAKRADESAWKLSDQLMAVEFKNSKTIRASAVVAIETAQNIMNEIDELNYQIQDKLKTKLRVKIGVAIKSLEKKDYFAKQERANATVGNTIVSSKVYSLTLDRFDFDEMNPVDVDGASFTFYRVRKESDPPKIETPPKVKPVNAPPKPVEEKESEAQIVQEPLEETKDLIAKEEGQQEFPENMFPREDIYKIVLDKIVDKSETSILSLAAPDGLGKTTLISSLRQNLSKENIVWLYSNCQPLSQIVPFSFFQEALKNLIGLPQPIVNIDESRTMVTNFVDITLGIKNKEIEDALVKLIFPEANSDITSITTNRDNTYGALKDVIKALNKKFTVVILVEDIEYIDKASLEFIKDIHSGFDGEDFQIIASHSSDFDIDTLFPEDEIKNVVKLFMAPMNTENMEAMVMELLYNQDVLPAGLKAAIIENANGSPFYIEQALWLLFQIGAITNQDGAFAFDPQSENLELPKNIEEVVEARLAQLNNISENLMFILINAAMLGQKFIPELLQKMISIDSENLQKALQSLASLGIIVNYDKYNLAFKHKIIWETVYKSGFTSGHKTDLHFSAFNALKSYTLSNSTTLALHAELAEKYADAFDCWNRAGQEAISVGDEQSFTTSQYRMINLLDKIDSTDVQNKEAIKLNLYEQVGKVNYRTNPDEAIKYLSNAILEREKSEDAVKVIDLAGYLSKSCEIKGNYAGAVECSDKALVYLDRNQMPLEYALLSYSKLEALYNLGRLGECVNIIQTDILPQLDEALTKGKTIEGVSLPELDKIKLKTLLVLSKALTLQGNKECLFLADEVAKRAKSLNYPDIEANAKIVESQYRALQGDMVLARGILDYAKGLSQFVKNQNLLTLYVLFTELLFSMLEGKFKGQSELPQQVLSMAEEQNEYLLQIITRLFVGKMLKESALLKQAKEVYNETTIQCSENKYATGAILGWYLISEAEIESGETDKAADIAEKAFEITQKPEIKNDLFSMMFLKTLSEIHIIRGDFELADIMAKQAYDIAAAGDLKLFMSKLALTFGRLYLENATVSDQNREQNAVKSHGFLMQSLDIAQNIENEYMITQIEKEFLTLSALCQLSGITI